MSAIEIKKGIYWVGAIDWDVRNFHGYLTQRGATYNAYLIVDEKITLVDTVKHYLADEMVRRISKIIDPSKIDYVVSNHVEMDHSGSLVKIMELAPNATIITSPNGEKGLERHYKKGWKYQIVKSGDVLNLGKRSLNFILTPMVHWPDSMVSYMPEEKLLLPNDAFGQHIATSERFDDELDLQVVLEEARKYYANIVLPFGAQVQGVLKGASGLDIEMIAPSHGIIWRSHIAEIVTEYQKWAANETTNQAVIVYDSMWGSTEKIAIAIKNALEDKGINYKLFNLKTNHISDIMTHLMESKYIFVGSPTLNNTILPTVAGFLTYIKGLKPKNRVGMAFGSYGWSGESTKDIQDIFEALKFETLEPVKISYIPDKEELEEVTEKLKAIL